MPPANDQRGYFLIEVIVGAMLLVLIGLGIFSGIDGASNASGRNRNRSVAAFLAQQDQERMRTLTVDKLNDYAKAPYTRNIVVGGITYSMTSKTSYANDTNGDVSCTSGSRVASYMRITSTVSDPTGRNKPVVIDSLVSPHADENAEAGASVQVLGADGTTAMPGVHVYFVEDPSKNDVTDANGCVQYAFLSGTSYHVTISEPGYVDKDGNPSITNYQISAAPGSSVLTPVTYAPAMTLRANFKAQDGTTTVNGRGFTVSNAKLSGTQTKAFLTGNGANDTAAYTSLDENLFPFSDGYQVYAGSCAEAVPTASTSTYVVPAPRPPSGSTLTTISLPMPKVPIVVQQDGSPLVGADVVASDACGAKYPTARTIALGVANLNLPFSTAAKPINICVDNNAGASSRYVTTTVVSTGNVSTQTLNIKTSGLTKSPSGAC